MIYKYPFYITDFNLLLYVAISFISSLFWFLSFFEIHFYIFQNYPLNKILSLVSCLESLSHSRSLKIFTYIFFHLYSFILFYINTCSPLGIYLSESYKVGIQILFFNQLSMSFIKLNILSFTDLQYPSPIESWVYFQTQVCSTELSFPVLVITLS